MNTTGYIGPDGKYHRGEKPDISSAKHDRNILDKNYSHDRQREQHRRDILQPYKNGKPNPEFITAYPTEAKHYGML